MPSMASCRVRWRPAGDIMWGKETAALKPFFSQKITIWGIKTLFASVGRGGGRVGWGSGLARRWGRGRVGSARRGPDSQELKSGVQREGDQKCGSDMWVGSRKLGKASIG